MSSSRPSKRRATRGDVQREESPAPDYVDDDYDESLLSDKVVTIYTGPEEKKWVVHENLLSSTSEFFRASFRGGFQEAQDSVLRLPEDQNRTFELFVGWLYSQPLSTLNGVKTKVLSVPDDKKVTIGDYIGLYVFASKYIIEDLLNETLDCVYDYYQVPGNYPKAADMETVYHNTTEDAKMRDLLTVLSAFRMFMGHRSAAKDWGDVLRNNGEIGHDIITMVCDWKVKMGTDFKARSLLPKCHFHTHKNSPKCTEVKTEEDGMPRLGLTRRA